MDNEWQPCLKSKTSSLQQSSVAVHPGFCQKPEDRFTYIGFSCDAAQMEMIISPAQPG